jgi:hypothetical protein
MIRRCDHGNCVTSRDTLDQHVRPEAGGRWSVVNFKHLPLRRGVFIFPTTACVGRLLGLTGGARAVWPQAIETIGETVASQEVRYRLENVGWQMVCLETELLRP